MQEVLAGPAFLIMLQTFLSTVDCACMEGDCVERSKAYEDCAEQSLTYEELGAEPMNCSAFVLSGKMSIELQQSEQCWEGTQLLYATAGLTSLTAFVPLACLTMVNKEDDSMHFRYTPFYHRLEVIGKALMAMVCQFTNTTDPNLSFPLMCGISLYMLAATRYMQPCCIIWANRLKVNAYTMQLWTGISGLIGGPSARLSWALQRP